MSFLSNMFGGGSSALQNFQPAGFQTGGVSATFGGGKYNINQSPAMTQQIGQLQSTFGQQAQAFGNLAQTVQPGFSQMRQAQLSDLSTQQQALKSNLQQNLAQRRILGSSFAQNTLTQADAEYQKQRDQVIAQSYLAELNASNQLIQEQYQAASQQFAVGINQMNFDSGLAAQLTSQATSSMAAMAAAQAQLDAKSAAGVGSFIGSILTAPSTSIIGKGLTAAGTALV